MLDGLLRLLPREYARRAIEKAHRDAFRGKLQFAITATWAHCRGSGAVGATTGGRAGGLLGGEPGQVEKYMVILEGGRCAPCSAFLRRGPAGHVSAQASD